MNENKNDLLLVHKPSGVTSFSYLREFQRKTPRGRLNLGHAGTLDAFASGLLVLMQGESLKLGKFFFENYPDLSIHWKTYRAKLQWGLQTDTGDPTGIIVYECEPPSSSLLTYENLMKAFPPLDGSMYLQKPPLYSAKKVNGQRASDLVRQGEIPDLKTVPVFLKDFKILTDASEINSGLFEFEITCSKGTYIRALVEDLAKALGSCAHLKTLHRTAIGPFLDPGPGLHQIISLEDSIKTIFPYFEVSENIARRLHQGFIPGIESELKELLKTPHQVHAAFYDSKLISLLKLNENQSILIERNFN